MPGGGFAVRLDAVDEFPAHLNDLPLVVPAGPLLLPFGCGVRQDDGAAPRPQHVGQGVQGTVEGGERITAGTYQLGDLFESLHGTVRYRSASRFCHAANLPRRFPSARPMAYTL